MSCASLWIESGAMPASNHDISAAVLNRALYVAGGLTEIPDCPPRARAFDEIWRLEADRWTWSVAAKLGQPRVYCATAAFAGRIWIVGGDTLQPDGSRLASTWVQIFNPRTGEIASGPALPVAQPAPLALVGAGRLYVMGAADRTSAGRMDSLGAGETVWRREPDGPPAMWALAGAEMGGQLHVCVPQLGLARFDPAVRSWEVIGGRHRPRSPQVAAWRDELWITGGREIADGTITEIFNPVAGTWRDGPPLPRALAWGAAGVLADCLVIAGGAGAEGYSDRTFRLTTDWAR